VQEGAFDKPDNDDGVAKFMHGMLERVVEGDGRGGVGLFAEIAQLLNLISAVLQNNKFTDIGIIKPFKREVVSSTFGKPIPYNPVLPVYGAKTMKMNIVSRCNSCPADSKYDPLVYKIYNSAEKLDTQETVYMPSTN
jgi:hypothetical protein